MPAYGDLVFTIYNYTDTTKQMNFDLSGEAAGKRLILAASNTADATITFPSATATLPGIGLANVFTAAQTITPATDVTALRLNADSTTRTTANIFEVYDAGAGSLITWCDAGGVMTTTGFNLLGGSYTGAFATATLSTSRTWTFPNATGTLSIINNSETLTNKTITRLTTSTTVKGQPVIAGENTGASTANLMARINQTAKTADIASANLTDTCPAAMYRINWVLECTTADAAAGAVTVNFAWTDDVGATTGASSAQALTATGRTEGSIRVYLASGNITYSTTHTGSYGTSQYALRVRVECLG